MKIALVNPRVESYSSSLPPLGLLYVAAVLEKEGFDVKIFDMHPRDTRDLDKIISFSPEIVGVSILTAYVTRAKKILFNLKKHLGKAYFVIGGVHPTALPEQSIDFFEADCIVVGEGEETMKHLCHTIQQGTSLDKVEGILYRNALGELKRTENRKLIGNLDTIPFPGRHLIEFEKYLFPPGVIRGYWSENCTSVMTSRGCPYQCIWCGSQIIFGRKVRRRSAGNVIQEIELLKRKYKVDTIWFIDDTFTTSKKWVTDFCNQLIMEKIDLKWGCQAHVETVDKEMMVLMKNAGLVQLDFGVESGSDKVLRILKKHSDEKKIKKAFNMAKKVGIRTMATFMFGNPGENKEDIEKTFKLAKRIKPNFVSSYFLTPFPGTELMQMAGKNHWLICNNYDLGGLKKEPMMTINFSPKHLIRIRARFQRQFVLTNFFSVLKNFHYMKNAISLVLRYPKGILIGTKAFLKTHVFDDFVFTFLTYYAEQREK